ncbi:hypothetical protein DFH09DRAFT_1328096 [Mycena vulgaris]|nr:hypothetical protein DFH09DRAFT_1328096 [Mycena vulgaris]
MSAWVESERWKGAAPAFLPLPTRFITPGSQETARTIDILATIVMEQYTIILSDFCRITSLYVISSTCTFGAEDLEVDSTMWNSQLEAKRELEQQQMKRVRRRIKRIRPPSKDGIEVVKLIINGSVGGEAEDVLIYREVM